MSGQTVGSGTGERVSKSGKGWEASGQIVAREESGTGTTVHLAVGRETREQKSVTGEVGKGNIATVSVPYRSRTVPTTFFPVPTFTARSPGYFKNNLNAAKPPE